MNDELYHHGIKGQKWGVRRTPQQLGYSIGTRRPRPSGKVSVMKTGKKYAKKIASLPSSLSNKIRNKIRARQEKKLARRMSKREKYARDPEKMYKNRDLFTKDEINAYVDRFAAEERLRNINSERAYSKYKRGMDYVEAVGPAIKTIGTAYDLYKKYTDDKKPKTPVSFDKPDNLPETFRQVTIGNNGQVSYTYKFGNEGKKKKGGDDD